MTITYIFLDLDGVLVRESPLNSTKISALKEEVNFTPECLKQFENILRQFHNYRIVISSSWKELFTLSEIKSRFSPDIAVNVVGVTPNDDDPSAFYRYREVLQYLKNHQLEDVFWIAIDDIREHYPHNITVIVTNAEIGFNLESAILLAKYLNDSALR